MKSFRADHQAPILYLDIDGVLLGKRDPRDSSIGLANHAGEFLEFAVARFRCCWLSTHTSSGDNAGARIALSRHADSRMMELVDRIPAAKWVTLKTEALDLQADFYWIDDGPLATEIDFLEWRGLLDRWIYADTRRNPDDLDRVTSILSTIVRNGAIVTP